MNEIMKAHAIIIAAAARVNARIAGMEAFNRDRELHGQAPGYTDEDFYAVVDQEGRGHNAVCHVLVDR